MSSTVSEIERLRRELQDARDTLHAIQNGEVDAFVVQRGGHFRVEALTTAYVPYQVLVESIRDGALTVSSRGLVLYCNEPFARQVADKAADISGRSISEWLDLEACTIDSLLAEARAGEAWKIGILRARGRSIPVTVTACALPNDDDKNVFCLLLRDRSDRVEAEELRLERARLARQRAELDAICKRLPFAVLLVEAPGSFGYLNPFAEKLLDSYPDLGGQIDLVRLAVSQGMAVEGREATVSTSAGAESTFRFYATPLELEGTGNAALVMLEDVTTQRQAERERERQEQFREMFMGILGHDLRSPLMSIVTGADLLERGLQTGQVGRTAQRIQRASNRMRQLIDDMLDFTLGRVGGGIPLARSTTDLLLVVNATIEELEPTAGVQILVDFKGDVTGHWDMVRLAQVVSNLLTNAVEHGAPSIPIEVVLDGSAADQVLLTIKNQGRPIPPEVIPHLFEAFRRGTEQVPTRGRGVGLGLYIAERIVTAHGGRISVHSSEAEGTTFVVELPRDAPEPAGSLS